ncbi:MAG: hypothetical protein ABSF71_32885 [Terriglobia bacterium]
MKRLVGVAAALMMSPCPEFAGLLFFLYLFWENLGDLTLRIYDDQLMKVEKARTGRLSAKGERYCVRMLTMMSMAERKRRSRALLAGKRMIKAAYRAVACASSWVRYLIQGGQTVPMPATTDEE